MGHRTEFVLTKLNISPLLMLLDTLCHERSLSLIHTRQTCMNIFTMSWHSQHTKSTDAWSEHSLKLLVERLVRWAWTQVDTGPYRHKKKKERSCDHREPLSSKVVQGKPEDLIGANPGSVDTFQQKGLMEAQHLVIIRLIDKHTYTTALKCL